MRVGRLFVAAALVLLTAGGATPARAACASVSCLSQQQAALYLGCVASISAATLSGGQPVTSSTLVSQYRSLSQLSGLNYPQFVALEGSALKSYGCSLCLGDSKKHWVEDALKQFAGLGSVAAFTPATCLSTAAAFTFACTAATPTC